MATIAVPRKIRWTAERKFYSGMALFLVAIVFLGFASSFYLRGFVPPYPQSQEFLPWWAILHGTVMTMWMGILVAQTQLIAARQHQMHMALGTAAMAFAVALIPIMYLTAAWSVAASTKPMHDALTFTIRPLATMASFAILIWLAWRFRRQPQWHKRLMLSAAIVIVMGPAFARLIGRDVLPFTPMSPADAPFVGNLVHVLGLMLFIPLFVWDGRRDDHIHPATWLGFGVGAAAVAVQLAVYWGGLDWAAVAAKLPGIAH